MKKTSSRLVIIMMTLSVFAVSVLHAQPVQPPQPRTISVEGEATIYSAPDRASITLGVETEGTTASVVKKENDKNVSGLFEVLRKLGIEMKDIQTSGLTLQPVYNYKDGRREFVKYMMRNTVHVTVRDIAKLDKIIDASVEVGGNVIENVGFEISNSKDLRDKARSDAAKDAAKKAKDLASALGVSVGKPLSISSNDAYVQPVMMYAKMAMRGVADGGGGTESSGGELSIRVTVSATFEIQ